MGVQVIGFDKLEAKLTKNMDLSAVRTVVRKNGSEIEPTADYGAYVELGTRFMNAQPYLKPAFDEQKGKFKSDMKKLVR